MVDLDKVEGFEWDAGNARKSEERHGVMQAEAEQVFFNEPLFITADDKHSESERRYRALGETGDGRRLMIIFTLRKSGALIRVISARDMSARERKFYEQEIKANPEV